MIIATVSPWLNPNRPNDYTVADPAKIRVEQDGPELVLTVINMTTGEELTVSVPPSQIPALRLAVSSASKALRMEELWKP